MPDVIENILSTLPHDPDLGEGAILFGGSGFLGSYILANYPRIVSVGRTPCATANRHIHIDSLADLSALNDLRFDKVIFIIGHSDHHAMEQETLAPGQPTAFDLHVTPLLQVMEQLKNRNIAKFIHFSTVLLYADDIDLPATERSRIVPYKGRYPMSKFFAEELCQFYRRWMPVINCRISNLYGPTKDRRYDLINILTNKLIDNGWAEIWTTKTSRDFLYVEDAAHAVAKLLYADFSGTTLLASGIMTPVSQVVDAMRNVSGLPINSLDREVSGPQQFYADITNLQNIIDWAPQIPITEGVCRTFEFAKRWRNT